MIKKLALLALAIAASGCSTAQRAALHMSSPVTITTAQGPAACEDFRKNADGSWTPLTDAQVAGPGGSATIQANSTPFKAGGPLVAGVDIGDLMDKQCP